MSVGWNLLPNISFFFSPSKMIALHQNVANCQNTLTVLTHRVEDLSSRCMNGSDVYARCGHDTRQPPVGGLPISQDRLVRDRTIPMTLPSGKNIRANMLYKISIGYTNLDKRQIQGRLGSSRPIARFRRGGPLAGFGSVAVEAHPTLEYHKVKGDKTYNMEAPWLRRAMANCPAYPVLNPALRLPFHCP